MLLRSALREHWNKVDDGVRARVAAAALVPATIYSRDASSCFSKRTAFNLFKNFDILIGLSHVVPPEKIHDTRSTLGRPEDFNKKIAHASECYPTLLILQMFQP